MKTFFKSRFSVVDYTLNTELAKREDIQAISDLGIDLKLDFILNHASVLSEQFQDIIKNGDASKYRDFFIEKTKQRSSVVFSDR
mgnify:CR=1 FL=1